MDGLCDVSFRATHARESLGDVRDLARLRFGPALQGAATIGYVNGRLQ